MDRRKGVSTQQEVKQVPLFVLIGRDGDGAGPLRREHLQSHLAWVTTVMAQIRVAGPLRDATGNPCMSLYIVEADDELSAHRFIHDDPYFRAGIWKEVQVLPFVAAAGTWVDGAAWLKA
jgi:hypothetical protein